MRVGDIVGERTRSCSGCLYYFPEYDDHRCEAPLGVNNLCMEQFREWKKTPEYREWLIDYYAEINRFMSGMKGETQVLAPK